MIVQLEMGPNFQRAAAELGSMGRAVVEACSVGLAKGVKIAAGRVASDYLSGQSLKRRTGQLARAVDGWMEGQLEGVVGVRPDSAVAKYAWLLGDEDKTITPKNAKFLTIPIAENLTGSGVARYSSPRQVPDGFFVKTGGRLLFGYKKGKRGKFRPLFVLVKSVFVQGSGALYDGVLGLLNDITGQIEEQVGRKDWSDLKMANDGGLMARLEQWLADTLKALINGGEDVFKTAEVWKHQIGQAGSGIESFTRYEPFAFVSYWPADAAREGDYDLRQVLRFSILIGVESKSAGDARVGNSNQLGVSKIRDLVIAALDRAHPGEGFDCDDLFYTGETEMVDTPKRYALEMHFQTNFLGV